MKFLLLSFFLVLFTTPTWAHGLKEPVYPPYCYVQPPGSELWYECGSEEAQMIDCLKLMELAMKAIDPYIKDFTLLDNEEKVRRDLKLWDRAKNSCWSDLKNLQPQHYH